MTTLRTEELIMNMGPQHPSTHGVLRLVLYLDGETIDKLEADIGYLHRGIEKLGETLQMDQFMPYTDRLDYVCAMSNNLGYVQAVEKLCSIEVPKRAEYMRIAYAELSRISGHLLWLGTHALDIGAMTVFLYAFREREEILNFFENFCGARLTTNAFRFGGCMADMPEGEPEKIIDFTDRFLVLMEDYERLLTKNRIWLKRTQDVAIITKEDAIAYGLTGSSLRGSGVNWDIRKAMPYGAYEDFDFTIPVEFGCDVYARYLVRMEEMRQSCRIIKQAMQNLPEGEFQTKVKKIKAPEGAEVYHSIEAPKGELGFYIRGGGKNIAQRLRIRGPSFVNLQSLPLMCEGELIADVIAAIGSLDIVLGEVDR
ncbi:MAG: NADH-quinone oxidoreductase subunit D [Nitrospinae bacterium]|nr:NADH-quinone oxidoreductase subunit D [Nitrospinota bacterium]